MDTINPVATGAGYDHYQQLITRYDPQLEALWAYMSVSPRPCFSRTVLSEIIDLHSHLAERKDNSCEAGTVNYLVGCSATPGVWSLGGDLSLFLELIRTRNRGGLEAYARACVDVGYLTAVHPRHRNLTTISLVQGLALGGGFEGALCANVVIAERSAQFAFPETLFSLFPGLCGPSVLMQRMDPARVERFLTDTRQYSAEELLALGLIDQVCGDGEGPRTVNAYIRQHRSRRNGLLAARHARERAHPLNYLEMLDISQIWVDAAMRLTDRDLKTINRLVSAQNKRLGTPTVSPRHEIVSEAVEAAAG